MKCKTTCIQNQRNSKRIVMIIFDIILIQQHFEEVLSNGIIISRILINSLSEMAELIPIADNGSNLCQNQHSKLFLIGEVAFFFLKKSHVRHRCP